MNTIVNTSKYEGELSVGQKSMRVVVGASLVLVAMFYQGPFAEVALLPLLAVYPIITGLIGVDPVYLIWQKITGMRTEYSVVSRGLLVATATVLIGSVMVGQGELGWHGILALVAVYPVVAAIVGKDPLNGFVTYAKENNIVPLRETTPTIPERKAA